MSEICSYTFSNFVGCGKRVNVSLKIQLWDRAGTNVGNLWVHRDFYRTPDQTEVGFILEVTASATMLVRDLGVMAIKAGFSDINRQLLCLLQRESFEDSVFSDPYGVFGRFVLWAQSLNSDAFACMRDKESTLNKGDL